MDYREAKSLYSSNEFQETICHSKLCNYANTGCSDCEITHMNILINEALEKMASKKLATNGENFGGMLYKFCPSCGHCMGLKPNASHCSECGQAIGWEEE